MKRILLTSLLIINGSLLAQEPFNQGLKVAHRLIDSTIAYGKNLEFSMHANEIKTTFIPSSLPSTQIEWATVSTMSPEQKREYVKGFYKLARER